LSNTARALAETRNLAAETSKLEVDAANVRRLAQSDARRFTLTVLAPTVTALAWWSPG